MGQIARRDDGGEIGGGLGLALVGENGADIDPERRASGDQHQTAAADQRNVAALIDGEAAKQTAKMKHHVQYPPRGIAAERTMVDGGDGTNDGSE